VLNLEILVDENPDWDQYFYYPHIGSLTGGGFVIVWQTWIVNKTLIHAQIFDAYGNKVGTETELGANSERAVNPMIAGLKNGNFVTTWQTSNNMYSDNAIMAQLLDYSGNKIGNEFRANRSAPGIHALSFDIGSLNSGKFIISWRSWDETYTKVVTQIFTQDGQEIGWDFQVNSRSNISKPGVCGLDDGGFVIAWCYSHDGIYGKFYSYYRRS